MEKNVHWLRKRLLHDNLDASDALLKKHPIPFQVVNPKCNGEQPFLACEYNRTTDNRYRSPWTNASHPKLDDDDNESKNTAFETNEELRLLETTFNEVWGAYKNLYYGNDAIGSVYLQDSDSGAFQGLFGIQKNITSGSWNSVSFVRITELGEKECTYTVETSLHLIVEPSIDDVVGTTKADISLHVSKDVTKACKIQPDKVPINVSHIEHIGSIIEANEIDLRSHMEKVLIPKNQEIMDTIQTKQLKRPQVNPLMGMVMNSDLMKKKLAKAALSGT